MHYALPRIDPRVDDLKDKWNQHFAALLILRLLIRERFGQDLVFGESTENEITAEH